MTIEFILCYFPVISSYREPVRGWIDNVYGPTGLLVGAGTGVLHTYLGDPTHITDMVPVDLAANALIASAYKTGQSGIVERLLSMHIL